MKLHRLFSVCFNTLALFLFVYLLIFGQYVSQPTRDALYFCGNTLIPSLFIYMILAKTVMSLPFTDKLSDKFGYSAMLLVIGTLCGAPIGAKNALSLYRDGRISKKYAEYLCSFTNNASLSFVVSYVGGELLHSRSAGVALLMFQILSSVITAMVMRYVIFGREKMPAPIKSKTKRSGLREAVSDSALTMINLCAWVVFFIVIGGAVSRLLNLPPVLDALLKSTLEFSSGCAVASKVQGCGVQLCAFSVGFTGLSVALQVRSVIAGQLSVRPYLLGKLISGSIMTFLAVICG